MSHPQWPVQPDPSEPWHTPPQDPYASSTGWPETPPPSPLVARRAYPIQQPQPYPPQYPQGPQQPSPYVHAQQPYGPPQGYPPPYQQAPQSIAVVQNNSVTVARQGTNHRLHFILTCVTCGMWALVWFVVWLFGRG